MVLEIERIKALKAHEEKEKAKAREQKIGAQVIIQQIQEREAERIRSWIISKCKCFTMHMN